MASSITRFFLIILLFLVISFFQLFSHKPLCRKDERIALMQFKDSFVIKRHASNNPFAYPKVNLWKSQEIDCCLWEGIWCDQYTGHVIGLDLSSSCLFGSINSSSSLFHLGHLQYLNLAFNDFNYSEIPEALGNLSRLAYLNLSHSLFYGQVPFKISKLSKLTKLDLSLNFDYSYQGLLELKRSDLNSLIHNFTKLEWLDLSLVKMYSLIPNALANFSSLKYLCLTQCGLVGMFPTAIFQLSKLEYLFVDGNWGLTGSLPKFHFSNPLKELSVANTSFPCEFPTSFGRLSSLQYLNVRNCKFSRLLPSSLSNLTKLHTLSLRNNSFKGSKAPFLSNLTQLRYVTLGLNQFTFSEMPSFASLTHLHVLDLYNNCISGQFPFWFVNLTQLTYLGLGLNQFTSSEFPSFASLTHLRVLDLYNNYISGQFPSWLANLTRLTYLGLGLNQFTSSEFPSFASLTHLRFLDLYKNYISGQFPSWLVNLTQLTYFGLGNNMLRGSIPSSISRLKNLEAFDVQSNNLSGIMEFETFLGLKRLQYLCLFDNNFSLLIKTISNDTVPKFVGLELGSCNLSGFLELLHGQYQLAILDLSFNNIHGQIPKWLLKMSSSLWYLNLQNNFLTSFEESSSVIPSGLSFLNLHCNFLTGSLPIPPRSIFFYMVAKNKFSGGIPPQFCNMTSLQFLDLSHNNLSGILPQCLGNLSKSLSFLNLEENNFHGSIPETWAIGNELKVIKLGHNNLWGKLPRSLANCKMLEYLDLGNNQIRDTFPPWLGVLSQLKIIILCFNEFYGAISGPKSYLSFPKLHIIDLSHNESVGPLPMVYFKRWNIMANLDGKNTSCLHVEYDVWLNGTLWPDRICYSMTITNKGEKIEYAKIFEIFMAIDLSCNKFEGEIPEVVGNLTRLQLLNLSSNMLTGPIPPALAYLTNLEVLDLSHNKLTGRIPWQLMHLNFLEVFSVSNNHLTGPIPEGQQFDTFESSSFDGNAGLCGMALSKKCDDLEFKVLPPSSTSEEDSGFLAEFGWKIVFLGYGCGFLVGVVIGIIVFTRKPEWSMKTFRITQPRGQKRGCERLNRRMD